mmetsp:Transcript_13511/g.37391  ORF Transcript_13511/g.37391 Transcript_13511/m.37391 type:complete len:244 (-) Transcript_13511:646-1377(-)
MLLDVLALEAGRGVAQQLADEVDRLGVDVHVVRDVQRRLPVEDLAARAHRVVGVERRVPHEHLVDDDPQRPPVALGAVTLLDEDLGRDIVRGSHRGEVQLPLGLVEGERGGRYRALKPRPSLALGVAGRGPGPRQARLLRVAPPVHVPPVLGPQERGHAPLPGTLERAHGLRHRGAPSASAAETGEKKDSSPSSSVSSSCGGRGARSSCTSGTSKGLQRPKSVSARWPLESKSQLSGLMSRWV